MKNQRKTYRTLFLCTLLFITFIISGCMSGNNSDTDSSSADSETLSEEETTPAFLDAAVPVSGSKNLSELHTNFLTGTDYSEALKFGENLLLVYMYTPDSANNSEEANEEWEYEENFRYQFDLYSLKENAIIATLNTEDISGDFYQVVGQEFYLVDYENNILRRYDTNLSPLGTYDATELMNVADCFLYASSEPDSCYVINYDDNTLIKITFTENDYTLLECDTDYYCSYISMSSPDGTKLLFNTVNKNTFFSETRVVNTADMSDVVFCSQSNFFYSVISDDAFLAEFMDEPQPYHCNWFDGETVYFTMPDEYYVSLMGDLILATRNSLYDYDTNDLSYSAFVYDRTGACTSAISYNGDSDGNGETDIYISSEPMYFEEYNCAFILANDVENGGYFLIWDLGTSGDTEDTDNLIFYDAAEDVPAIDNESNDNNYANNESEDYDSEIYDSENYGTIVTEIPDRGTYDWGDLSEARSRANTLEETYGISIYIGPEVPSQIGVSYSAGKFTDADSLLEALDILEEVLELYPKNFFSQLCYDDIRGIRIYLAGTLYSNSEDTISDASAYVEDVNSYKVMVLDTNQYWDWDYTINHEISHMIDKSLDFRSTYQKDSLYSEEIWSSYNPEDFSYLYSYDDYFGNTDYLTWSDYFIDSYGTTFPTEDRAEIFGYAMENAINDGLYDYMFTDSDAVREKLAYYSDCIRSGFDTTGWPDTLPWEGYAE